VRVVLRSRSSPGLQSSERSEFLRDLFLSNRIRTPIAVAWQCELACSASQTLLGREGESLPKGLLPSHVEVTKGLLPRLDRAVEPEKHSRPRASGPVVLPL